MSYDIYRLIFIGAAIACGVMFLVSVILFIVFKIPNIIGNLTGHSAKKAIEDIKKQQNESYVINGEANESHLNGKKKITEKISTARLDRAEETTVLGNGNSRVEETTILGNGNSRGEETTILGNGNSRVEETTILGNGNNRVNETTILGDGNSRVEETTILGNGNSRVNETTILGDGNSNVEETIMLGYNGTEETTLLGNGRVDETAVLGNGITEFSTVPGNAMFIVTEEIRFIHTDEWIQAI